MATNENKLEELTKRLIYIINEQIKNDAADRTDCIVTIIKTINSLDLDYLIELFSCNPDLMLFSTYTLDEFYTVRQIMEEVLLDYFVLNLHIQEMIKQNDK